jgi:hypothetical protein
MGQSKPPYNPEYGMLLARPAGRIRAKRQEMTGFGWIVPQIGYDRPEIDVLGITSWHQRVVIVWHRDVIPDHGRRAVTMRR